MRRALLILAVVLLATACFAQTVDTVHYLDSATLAWDGVNADANGDPLLVDDVVTYEVYLYNSASTIDDQDVANLTFIGGTSATEMPIDFTGLPRAMFYAGVRAVVTDGQERLDQRITDVFRSLDRIEKVACKNTEDLQLLLRKTTNGWGDTLARHDSELKDKVTRKEFNDAMKSLRSETKSSLEGISAQVSTLKWIFAIGLTLISGLIAAGYFIV